MSDRYSITDTQTITATPGDTVLLLDQNGTTKRGSIYDLMIGDIGTPADNNMELLVRRSTATQTGDALVETALDQDAPAAVLEGTGNHTTEPTYTADSEVLDVGMNQRATFRWVAAPGGEWTIAATDNVGLGLVAIGPAATDHAATISWIE